MNAFIACKAVAFEVIHKISTNAMDTIHFEALVDVLLTMVTVKTRRTGAKEISSRVFTSASIFTRGRDTGVNLKLTPVQGVIIQCIFIIRLYLSPWKPCGQMQRKLPSMFSQVAL